MNTKKPELTYQEKCFNKDRIIFQNKMVNLDYWQCCKNCIHMHLVSGECKLFCAKPPIDVIVVGCENWEYDIPF